MRLVADVHLHSYFSRATSKQLNLEHLYKWAQLKGVHVVGTGDIAHPGWLAEMKTRLQPAEEGLYSLKPEVATAIDPEVFKACRGPVRFMLAGEISNIYKKNDKVRKIHNVVFLPSFEAVEKFQAVLDRIGNIRSDGRPILGLDSRDLLEIVLETDPQAYLIPAHIWTPWFALLGSMSGFDSVEECFDDLTPHIFALETGLSSDPPMNWRLSALDHYTLVSNSDAHSPQKLAREANLFETELSYQAIFHALKTGDPAQFLGTIEFFPEEGKYHYDGHRKCGIRWDPKTTLAHDGICPECGRGVTVGVMHRVEKLADREFDPALAGRHSFKSLIPLPEVLAEIYGVGVNTKKVREGFEMLLSKLGSELHILMDLPLEELDNVGGQMLAEGIKRMRDGQVRIAAGYDGEYGTIRLFDENERESFSAQLGFFAQKVKEANQLNPTDGLRIADAGQARDDPKHPQDVAQSTTVKDRSGPSGKQNGQGESKHSHGESNVLFGRLNDNQRRALRCLNGPLIILAGPGTGKTRTLTYRLAYLVLERNVPAREVLAITFTNKASEEMRARVKALVSEETAEDMTICTFHALGRQILREAGHAIGLTPSFTIITEKERKGILSSLFSDRQEREVLEIGEKISLAKNRLWQPDADNTDQSLDCSDDFRTIFDKYETQLRKQNVVDFDDLILMPVRLFEQFPDIKRRFHQRFKWISVDEYQDINFSQYVLLKHVIGPDANVCVIGDPDQSIYGFRGSSREFFLQFKEKDFPSAEVINLSENYRSAQAILKASTNVILKGNHSKEGSVWSKIVTDKKVDVYSAATEHAEAEFVVHQIEKMVGGTSYFSMDSGRVGTAGDVAYSFKDFAILYRLTALANPLKTALQRSGIPFQIVGDTPFFERKKISEVLSCLWFVQNPDSNHHLIAVLRGICKGLGKSSIGRIAEYGQRHSLSVWEVLQSHVNALALPRSQGATLINFTKTLDDFRTQCSEKSASWIVERVLNQFYSERVNEKGSDGVPEFEELRLRSKGMPRDLNAFLESTVLNKELDDYDNRKDEVTLMTLHAAKGLEFPVVFIVGSEETIIPYQRDSKSFDLDEERRLMYVGMTRAKERLFLTYAKSRFLFGHKVNFGPSRFIADIEQSLKEHTEQEFGSKRRQRSDNQISLF